MTFEFLLRKSSSFIHENPLLMLVKKLNKMDVRWVEGHFVGVIERTMELKLMTETGVKKSRSIRRLQPDERWKAEQGTPCCTQSSPKRLSVPNDRFCQPWKKI